MGRVAKGPRVAKKKPKSLSARARNRKPSPSLHMVRKVRSQKKRRQTGIEATVEQWLTAAGAQFKMEYAISRTHVDFYLPSAAGKGTVVEINGCFWHGCRPCNRKGLSKDQLKARRKDGRRYTFLRNAGYDLVLVWEHEIKDAPDKAKEKILKHASLAL